MLTRKLATLPTLLMLSLALAVAAAACGPQSAPEFRGIAGWLNSPGLSLEDQRGRVVLIDFWTYSCVNCIRTFPYLMEWHDKYNRYGLTIVGVHAPEFEFEKNRENVAEAARIHGLEYPIALDNDFATWNAYSNNVWPSKFLIDGTGSIRYAHRGEGAYTETEAAIRELLEETGVDLSHIPTGANPDPEFDDLAFAADPAQRITRELYAGHLRNRVLPSSSFATLMGETPSYFMHEEYYGVRDAEVLYEDHGRHFNHFLYLRGLWHNGAESITHARDTGDFQDYVAIKFYATSVNAVMGAAGGLDATADGTPAGAGSHVVRLTLDGEPLTRSQAGRDVEFDDAGNSFVTVDEPKLYGLVELPEFGGYDLQLRVNSTGLSLFTFTFGAYDEGP